MFHKYLNRLVLILALCGFYLPLLSDEQYFSESSYWPPKLKLSEPYQLESGKILPKGRHGVLIRMERSGSGEEFVLIDFGSDGVHALLPEQTDIASCVSEYRKGAKSKQFPNWTMMIGRAFVYVDKDSVRPIKLKEISGYEYMLFVYDDTLNSEKMDHLSQDIRTYSKALEAAKVLVVVLPASNLSGRVAYQEIQDLCKRYDLGLHYVYPYLSNAYIPSLQHEISVYPSCVLTDVEGKTVWISEYKKDTSVEQILQQLN